MPTVVHCADAARYCITLDDLDEQCIAPTQTKEGNRCRILVSVEEIKSLMAQARASRDQWNRQQAYDTLEKVVLLRCCHQYHRSKLEGRELVLRKVANNYMGSFMPADLCPNRDPLTPPMTPPRTMTSSPALSSPGPVEAAQHELRSSGDPRPRPTFTPYTPLPKYRNITVNSSLRSDVPGSHCPTGEVYVFEWLSKPGFFKIGCTGAKWQDRFYKWKDHHSGLEFVCSIKVPFPKRVEEVIHAELRPFRRQIPVCENLNCPKVHNEWFEMSKDDVKLALTSWENIIKRKAFYNTESRQLDEWWAAELFIARNDFTSAYLTSLLDESDRLVEMKQLAEKTRLAAEGRLAEEERMVEAERLAEEERIAKEEKLAEQERFAEEVELAEEEELAEQERFAEKVELAEEEELAEQERFAEKVEIAERERLAEEKRLAKEERLAEERRIAEQVRQVWGVDIRLAKRLAEQAWQIEEVRVAFKAREAEADQLEASERGMSSPRPLFMVEQLNSPEMIKRLMSALTNPGTEKSIESHGSERLKSVGQEEERGETNSHESSEAGTAATPAQLPIEVTPPAESKISHVLTPPASPFRHNSISPTAAHRVPAQEAHQGKPSSQCLTPPTSPPRHNTISPTGPHHVPAQEACHETPSSQSINAPLPPSSQGDIGPVGAAEALLRQIPHDDSDAILQAFSEFFGMLDLARAASLVQILATEPAAAAAAVAVTTTTTSAAGAPSLAAFTFAATPTTTKMTGDAPAVAPFAFVAAAAATTTATGAAPALTPFTFAMPSTVAF